MKSAKRICVMLVAELCRIRLITPIVKADLYFIQLITNNKQMKFNLEAHITPTAPSGSMTIKITCSLSRSVTGWLDKWHRTYKCFGSDSVTILNVSMATEFPYTCNQFKLDRSWIPRKWFAFERLVYLPATEQTALVDVSLAAPARKKLQWLSLSLTRDTDADPKSTIGTEILRNFTVPQGKFWDNLKQKTVFSSSSIRH